MRIQLAGLSFDDLLRLCGCQCGPDFIIRCVLIAPAEVISNRPLKKDRLLWYDADLIDERSLRIVLYINAIDSYRTLRRIIKTWDEIDKRRLTAAGTTDDADRLSALYREIDIRQRLRIAFGLREGHMVEADSISRRDVGTARNVVEFGTNSISRGAIGVA